MPLNILLSFALIRVTRPSAQMLLDKHGFAAFTLMVILLIALVPVAVKWLDYGTGGWLWALFGLCQRLYAEDGKLADLTQSSSPPANRSRYHNGLMPLLACLVAAPAYVWQEQQEFRFPTTALAAFVVGLGTLSITLYLFRRGSSRVQPGEPVAGMLRFVGRHTLEIYAIQLASSEIIVKLFPDLAP